MTDIVNSVSVM